MLHVHILRHLHFAGPQRLSAASGLVRIGNRFYVAADDENTLGVFDLSNDGPGARLPIFDGELPVHHDARKAAKPDLEALTALPAFAGHPFGALMAIGSGSRPTRSRAALWALDAQGGVQGPARHVDLEPLYAPLRAQFAGLNVEGAFVAGDRLCLLQRGNKAVPVNVCIAFDWRAVERWLRAAGSAPAASSITRFDLGAIDEVPLCFTDGCAAPDGGWVFCAAAEDTSDAYADGRCTGSVVGIVDAVGRVAVLQPLSLLCKAEGIAASFAGDRIDLLLVTDPDDRDTPALLLSATLAR